MTIDYDHEKNLHTLQGPRCALPIIFPTDFPRTILDVGCGTGTWLRAAIELGAREVFGVDGVPVERERLLFDPQFFRIWDLTTPVDLGRKFDVTLCLEVAEHLNAPYGPILIDSLVRHSDLIVFSGACPGQPGQHHVNCQWPAFWQRLFNERGFVCEDDPRWQIWDNENIEPWYRQNLFIARRNPFSAGSEPRLKSVLHPWMIGALQVASLPASLHRIEQGMLPVSQYLGLLRRAAGAKIRRKWQRLSKIMPAKTNG